MKILPPAFCSCQMNRIILTILVSLISVSMSAQIKKSTHLPFYKDVTNTITFNFFDAVALEPQNEKIQHEFWVTDSISVTLRSSEVTEEISSFPMSNIAFTKTDFKSDKLIITVRCKGYKTLTQVCPLPDPIAAFDVYLKKED